jgi:hypothetical protein
VVLVNIFAPLIFSEVEKEMMFPPEREEEFFNISPRNQRIQTSTSSSLRFLVFYVMDPNPAFQFNTAPDPGF